MTTIDRDRDRLRRLADAATPGPWVMDDDSRGLVGPWIDGVSEEGTAREVADCTWTDEADAEFITAARGAVPALLDALDRAEAERDEWRQTALDERGAALDLLEQIKVRDRRIQAVQHLVDQADHAGDWTVTCSRLQWAIDGTTPYRASEGK